MSEQDYHPRSQWHPNDKFDVTKRYPPRPRSVPPNEGSVKILPEGERPYGPFDIGRQLPYRG